MFTCFQAFEFPTQLKPILFWQDNIKYNALWTFSEDLLHGFFPIDGCNNLEATVTQRRNHHGQFCPTIVYNEYFLTRHIIIPFPSATSVWWEKRATLLMYVYLPLTAGIALLNNLATASQAIPRILSNKPSFPLSIIIGICRNCKFFRIIWQI